MRAEVHARIYDQVTERLTANHRSMLDGLLAKPSNSVTTNFNRLKQTPGPATPKTIRLWIERLEWLTGLIDPEPLLEGVTHTKLRQFAPEAAMLEVNDLLDISPAGQTAHAVAQPVASGPHALSRRTDRDDAGFAERRPRPRSNWKPCRISTGKSRKR